MNQTTSKEKAKAKALMRVIRANRKNGLVILFKLAGQKLTGEYHHQIDSPSSMAMYLLAVADKEPQIAQMLKELYTMMQLRAAKQQSHEQQGSKGQRTPADDQSQL